MRFLSAKDDCDSLFARMSDNWDRFVILMIGLFTIDFLIIFTMPIVETNTSIWMSLPQEMWGTNISALHLLRAFGFCFLVYRIRIGTVVSAFSSICVVMFSSFFGSFILSILREMAILAGGGQSESGRRLLLVSLVCQLSIIALIAMSVYTWTWIKNRKDKAEQKPLSHTTADQTNSKSVPLPIPRSEPTPEKTKFISGKGMNYSKISCDIYAAYFLKGSYFMALDNLKTRRRNEEISDFFILTLTYSLLMLSLPTAVPSVQKALRIATVLLLLIVLIPDMILSGGYTMVLLSRCTPESTAQVFGGTVFLETVALALFTVYLISIYKLSYLQTKVFGEDRGSNGFVIEEIHIALSIPIPKEFL